MQPRILFIGEGGLIDDLAAELCDAGFDILVDGQAQSGVRRARRHPPDAVILHGEVEGADGLEVLAELRAFFQRPLLFLSSERRLAADLRALELGADDILVAPVRPGEGPARLRAALRKRLGQGAAVAVAGDVEIDLARQLVRRRGEVIALSAREFELLAELARAQGGVVRHGALLNAVWGPDHVDNVEYLRVFVQSLRRKLEADPARPRLIQTQIGVGYRLALRC